MNEYKAYEHIPLAKASNKGNAIENAIKLDTQAMNEYVDLKDRLWVMVGNWLTKSGRYFVSRSNMVRSNVYE